LEARASLLSTVGRSETLPLNPLKAVVPSLAALGWTHKKIPPQHDKMRQWWGALGTAVCKGEEGQTGFLTLTSSRKLGEQESCQRPQP